MLHFSFFCGVCQLLVVDGVTTTEEYWFLLLSGSFYCVCGVGFFCNFLWKLQWVTIAEKEIWVRHVLFEIKRIPREQIKRCWICRKCIVVVLPRMSNIYRDCIVIDTGISRRPHQVEDGYNRKKQKYIILLDTAENRAVLRECGIMVENP
jgi:hypothetical protein